MAYTPYPRQPLTGILKARGVTQTQAAEALGMTFLQLRDMLLGRRAITPELADRITSYTGLPIEQCFTPEVLAKRPRAARLGLVSV